MITPETYDLRAVVQSDAVVTCHVLEPDYSFMFGSRFDDDGELQFQQFEKDNKQLLLDPETGSVNLEHGPRKV